MKSNMENIIETAKATLIFRFDTNDVNSMFYNTSRIEVKINNSLLSTSPGDFGFIKVRVTSNSILQKMHLASYGVLLLIKIDDKKEYYGYQFETIVNDNSFDLVFKP